MDHRDLVEMHNYLLLLIAFGNNFCGFSARTLPSEQSKPQKVQKGPPGPVVKKIV